MALNFPPTPTIGQVFPTSPAAGVPQFKWDGSAWSSTMTGAVRYEVAQTIPSAQQIQACTNINAASSGALNDVGRNLLHNPLFNIAQRGVGPWSANNVYTADRWVLGLVSDTVSASLSALSDSQRVSVGDEAATTSFGASVTGNAAAGAFSAVTQRIEGVRRLGNKTVTVSFWAWCNAGTPKLGASLDQIFGTGGSPSAFAQGVGQAITLSTTPTRYSLTFTLPSTSGKTLGTNGDDCSSLNLWFSSGSTNASRAGSIGVQSGTFNLWGVQIEIGSVATPLEKPDPQQDLAKCQRSYCIGMAGVAFGYAAAGSFSGALAFFPVTMRAIPLVAFSGTLGTDTNVSAIALDSVQTSAFRSYATVTATGAVQAMRTYTATADL
jgi:hypothetical protein